MIKGEWAAIKLPLTYDFQRLAKEVKQISDDEWGANGRTAPAFTNTQAIFLKGYAAAERNPSKDDRPALQQLPYTKELIYSLIPARPQNCVLSYLPPRVNVGLHIDRGEYFNQTLRIHFPVTTNKKVTMYFGSCYQMRPGEVWLLNNCAAHGVENAHKTKARIHLICDYLPTPELLALIEKSDRLQGKPSPRLHQKLQAKTQKNMA